VIFENGRKGSSALRRGSAADLNAAGVVVVVVRRGAPAGRSGRWPLCQVSIKLLTVLKDA
jgi:hypothetical protein